MTMPPAPPSGWAPQPPAPRKRGLLTKRNVAIGVGALVVLSLAYGAGARQEQTATAAATPTAVAIVTPDPTVTPTAEPEPTERPTPVPTLEPTPDTGDYLGYLTWSLTYSNTASSLLEDLSAALDEFDAPKAASVARRLLSEHEDAKAYLADHPPVACYADNHELMTKAVNHYIKATRAQIRWLDEFPFGSDADFNTFEKEVNAGGSDLEKATNSEISC